MLEVRQFVKKRYAHLVSTQFLWMGTVVHSAKVNLVYGTLTKGYLDSSAFEAGSNEIAPPPPSGNSFVMWLIPLMFIIVTLVVIAVIIILYRRKNMNSKVKTLTRFVILQILDCTYAGPLS